MAANKQRGEVEIQFPSMGTRVFLLRYDANAWAVFEQHYGKSLTRAFEDIAGDNVGYHFARCALYAGLQCNPGIKRGLTLDKCGALLDQDEGPILEKVIRAIMLARGVDIDALQEGAAQVEAESEGTGKGNSPAPEASTGTPTGATRIRSA